MPKNTDNDGNRAILDRMLQDKFDEILYLEKIHDSLNRKLNEISKQSIHKLITELETGGNIRFLYKTIKYIFYNYK